MDETDTPLQFAHYLVVNYYWMREAMKTTTFPAKSMRSWSSYWGRCRTRWISRRLDPRGILNIWQDTIVRWSGAKGIARITERLPHDFAHQVLESILGLFDIHSAAAAALYDLPAVAEGTWHGACLACAELARRSIIEAQYLPKLIDRLSKVGS